MDVVPGDRSASARTVAATFGVLAWIAVSLRCFVRLHIIKRFGWDDGLMVTALAFYTVFCSCMVVASYYGTGHHEANLTEEDIVIAKRLWWVCEVAYGCTTVALKPSVCIFLLRIAVHKIHRLILYSVMALTLVTSIVFLFVLLLQCHPISYFWDKSQSGHCIDWSVIIAMSWLWSVFAGICDFTVGIIPIFMVWNMNIDRHTKVAIAAILGLACIASSAVIIRMPFLHTFADPDFLWATTAIAVWTNIEVGLGIFASSLATLRPLLRFIRSKMGLQSTDQLQPSSQSRPSYFNGRSKNIFKPQSKHQTLDASAESRTDKEASNMRRMQRNAAAYDGHSSDDQLNQLEQPKSHNPSLLEPKGFEMTATEMRPSENL